MYCLGLFITLIRDLYQPLLVRSLLITHVQDVYENVEQVCLTFGPTSIYTEGIARS